MLVITHLFTFISIVVTFAGACNMDRASSSNQKLSNSPDSSSNSGSDSASNTNQQWNGFKQKYSRSYNNSDEEQMRFGIFVKNLNIINQHNSKKDAMFVMGINQFFDKTPAEMQELTPAIPLMSAPTSSSSTSTTSYSSTAPLLGAMFNSNCPMDWRVCGVVTAVRNQNNCGACWAFSATGALESRYYIKYGSSTSLNVLSTQALIDRSGNYGNAGCGAGNAVNAYQWIGNNNGDAPDSSYPYVGYQQKKCLYKSSTGIYQVAKSGSGYAWNLVNATNMEAAIIQALQNGPVNAAYYASSAFIRYGSGVFTDTSDCGNAPNHQMVIVGYSNTTNPYSWIVRNSWGSGWGMAGYVYIPRGQNFCSIESYVTYPLV